MVSRLKTAWALEGVASTNMPLTMDSWFVSQPLRQRLHRCGFTKIILAGKSHDTLTIGHKKPNAPAWKKAWILHDPTWGIDVPSCRVQGHSPPFGSLMRFFFQKSTTRSDSVMHVSQESMRGADIWPIWQQHHLIACFWKSLKSLCHIRSMP